VNRRLSTAEAARILGMREARIRELVRRGLGRPERRGRRYAFSFQDLVILRAAHALIEQNVPAARVARALSALAEALPEDRPISGLRIRADGRGVVVRDAGTEWDPETGQTLLDFALDELAERADDVRRFPEGEARIELSPGEPRSEEADRARVLFNQAIDLEDHDPITACDLYGEALNLDPDLVDAYVNLGRLAHESDKGVEAVRLYNLALERTPDDPIVHFNLALVVHELEGPEAALACYERAIALDPDFADAHYNLASLCETLGRPRDALRHYNAYRRMTQSS
jgi:tetratricopeptide (TPR) repeat protein